MKGYLIKAKFKFVEEDMLYCPDYYENEFTKEFYISQEDLSRARTQLISEAIRMNRSYRKVCGTRSLINECLKRYVEEYNKNIYNSCNVVLELFDFNYQEMNIIRNFSDIDLL